MNNDEEIEKANEKTYIECPKCERRINEEEKECPYCQYDLVNRPKIEKEEMETYKKWCLGGLIAIVVIVIIGLSISSNNTNTTTSANTTNKTSNISNNIKNITTKIEKAKITVADFSQMSKEEVQNWCNENKVKCNIIEDYSETIPKGAFVSQSINANSTMNESDKVTVIYSLGKKPTMEQQNALKKAETYSSAMHMSKSKIYDQLTSEYGEGFTAEAAQYAIDNIVADWNANALAKAKSYQTTMNMSKQRIYSQLISEYGEGFTNTEAQYAIDHLED